MTDAIPGEKWTTYLYVFSSHPVFACYSEEELKELINDCTVQTYAPNQIIVSEGALVDTVFFILSGQCEVRKQFATNEAAPPYSDQPIATLSEGENIGLNLVGLYSATGSRTTTVVALSEVMVLCLSTERLHRFVTEHPKSNAIFAQQLSVMKRMNFIKSVAPFSSIAHQTAQHIAEQIQEVSFPANTTIFKQGDKGDVCYLINSGKVEIAINTKADPHKVIAELETNGIFGESALMSTGLRNATALATENVVLSKIDRPLFNEIEQRDTNAEEALMQIQLQRCRPVKLNNIDVYKQKNEAGEETIVLRNAALNKYVQISEQGLFLWELLDGENSINEIAFQFFLEFHELDVEGIASHIVYLRKAGFIQLDVNEKVLATDKNVPTWVRVISKIRRVMEYRVAFGNADAWVTKVYNSFVWIFFTPPMRILFFFLIVLGFIGFVARFEIAISALSSSPYKWPLFYFQSFLVALTVPLHELAHAFMTKYYGRKVNCFGLGWLWLSPFAFCDTSDMWLSPKKQRLMVDLAGMYLNAILAGVAGIAAFFTTLEHPNVIIVLTLFSLGSYMIIIANLDTALEFDGYYALMDILDKPNLRLTSIKWVASFFSSEHKLTWSEIKGHKNEVIYCGCTLLCIFVLGVALPYFVFSYLLTGLFGVQNPLLTILFTLLAVTFSSLSIYREVLMRVQPK